MCSAALFISLSNSRETRRSTTTINRQGKRGGYMTRRTLPRVAIYLYTRMDLCPRDYHAAHLTMFDMWLQLPKQMRACQSFWSSGFGSPAFQTYNHIVHSRACFGANGVNHSRCFSERLVDVLNTHPAGTSNRSMCVR